jgi:hypothetical protein
MKTNCTRWPHLLAVQQRILVLHADERGPTVLACHFVEVRKLPAPHRTRANVAHLAALHEIMERLHCFFSRNAGVISMNLEEIEVRGLQARERGLDRIEDGCTRKSFLVDILRLFVEARYHACADARIVGNETKAFRRNHDLVTRNMMLAQR